VQGAALPSLQSDTINRSPERGRGSIREVEPGRAPVEHIDHVLIVDGDHEIRELVSGCLRKNGRRVGAAGGGRQMRAPACEG
jgi:hypothetical protein